jgi:hypothetical protein
MDNFSEVDIGFFVYIPAWTQMFLPLILEVYPTRETRWLPSNQIHHIVEHKLDLPLRKRTFQMAIQEEEIFLPIHFLYG